LELTFSTTGQSS